MPRVLQSLRVTSSQESLAGWCDEVRLVHRIEVTILSRGVPILTIAHFRSATEAYRLALGLDVLMDHGWIVPLGTSGHSAQFSLMERDKTAPAKPVSSFQADDVDKAFADVVRGGSCPETPTGTSSMFSFTH